MNVIWMGMGGGRHLAEDLAPIIQELGMKLICISEWPDGDIPGVEYRFWFRDRWKADLADGDIAIAPQSKEAWDKGPVKLVAYMAAGLPSVVSPMPAYLDVIKDSGQVALVASDKDEWRHQLSRLKADEELRTTMKNLCLEAAKQHTPEKAAEQWTDKLAPLLAQKTVPIIYEADNRVSQYRAECWALALERASFLPMLITSDHTDSIPGGCAFYLCTTLVGLTGKPNMANYWRPSALVLWDYQLVEPEMLPFFDFVGTSWQNEWSEYFPESVDRRLATVLDTEEKYDIGFVGKYESSKDQYGESREQYIKLIHGDLGGLIARNFFSDSYAAALAECSTLFDYQPRDVVGTRFLEALAMGKLVFSNYRKSLKPFDSYFVGYNDLEDFRHVYGSLRKPMHEPQLGRALVLREHTYDDRLNFVQKVLVGGQVQEQFIPSRAYEMPGWVTNITAPGEDYNVEIAELKSQMLNISNQLKQGPLNLDPCVAVVIPCLENDPLLEKCLEHLDETQGVCITPYVVSPALNDSIIRPVHHVQYETMLDFTGAVNAGIEAALSEYDNYFNYVLVLNADVFLFPLTLRLMIASAKRYDFQAVCPYSNCDVGWLHHEPMVLDDGYKLHPKMKAEELLEHEDALQAYALSCRERGTEEDIVVPWVAAYAALYPAELFGRGKDLRFDQGMKLVYSDEDFCRSNNLTCGVAMGAFALHIGAFARQTVEKYNPQAYQLREGLDGIHFWSKHLKKADIAFYSGQSWEQWTPESIHTTGIGGSETCQIHVARLLAEAGHNVTCYSDCGEEAEYDGVTYRPYDRVEFCKPDVFISVRKPGILQRKIGKVNLLWTHDTHYGDAVIPDHNIDRYIMLTPWHKSLWADWWMKGKIPDEKYVIIPDGIDLERFVGVDIEERSPTNFLWASSPDRGLEHLIAILDPFQAEGLHLSLFVAYGFQGMEKWAPQSERIRQKLTLIRQMMDERDWVHDAGRISQDDLAKAHARRSVYVSPTDFTETFGITYLEAQAAGCPVITSNLAGLRDTLGGSAILINGSPAEESTRNVFRACLVAMIQSKKTWDEYRQAGLLNSSRYNWPKVVAQHWLPLVASLRI